MNKVIRLVVVSVFLLAILAIGMNGAAWADKLGLAGRSPAASGPAQGLSAGSRPKGTVTTTQQIVTLTSDLTSTVGSCATIVVKSAPSNVGYIASVVPDTDLAAGLPGNLISCGVKISANPGNTLGADTQVCFPIPPDKSGFAYYWDGSKWVKTTLDVKDGQSCVIVPASAANPAFVALFDK